ncbi:MAG TPA: anthranilate synthase component I family protein [Egibacteraceae bacterium]|nr:anthranilate synthase component I family protein [Egibacteraceae bacterium]
MRPQEPWPGTVLEELPTAVDVLAVASLPGLRLPQVHTVRGWQVALADPVAVVEDACDLDALGRRCGWRAAAGTGMPPFLGGAAGFVTDACAAAFVDLPDDDPRPGVAPLPGLCFGVYDAAVCVPPGGERAWLVAADLPGLTRRPPSERLADLRRRVRAATARRPDFGAHPRPASVELSLPAPAHAAAVARVLAWIAAGDLYQLNLTLQAAVPWTGGGLALARRLQAASPGAAHAAYARLPGGVEIVSVSPETFLRSDADRIVTRPIKGTRPRYDDRDRDAAAERQLRASEKDNAEHVMIVDLERNDLGRVCVPGTIEVPELAALEGHPTVWHLTSTVTGRLRADVGLGGLLAATFPSGSVTGAPKRMAVARTRLVEPVRRGVYCGALGVVSRGLVDLSVAIRTAVVHDGVARYGTGGAIVADSDPDEEFAEAMTKAVPFLRVTNGVLVPAGGSAGGGRRASGDAPLCRR